MSDEITIITNNVPRDLIDAWELSEKEREQFDYLNWEAIDAGNDSAQFFRYRGDLYDLSNFMRTEGNGSFAEWDGYESDSFFSGTLIRYPVDKDNPKDYYSGRTNYDYERVIVGRYYG